MFNSDNLFLVNNARNAQVNFAAIMDAKIKMGKTNASLITDQFKAFD